MKNIMVLLMVLCVCGYSQSPSEQSFALSSAIEEQDPSENIQVDTMPSPISSIAPKYPEIARKLGVEAMIWLKLVINEKGEASKVVVFKSNLINAGKGTANEAEAALNELNAAAVDAARQWKFNPAVLNGKPVKVWVTLPFKFKLDGSKPEKKNEKK
jgi:TonB family protein